MEIFEFVRSRSVLGDNGAVQQPILEERKVNLLLVFKYGLVHGIQIEYPAG
jgi:hypothetical protein